jgi:hypothetical protein
LGPFDKVATTVEVPAEPFNVLVTMTGGGPDGRGCAPWLIGVDRDDMIAPGGIVVLVAWGDELGGLPMGKVVGPDAEGGGDTIKDDTINAYQDDANPRRV